MFTINESILIENQPCTHLLNARTKKHRERADVSSPGTFFMQVKLMYFMNSVERVKS